MYNTDYHYVRIMLGATSVFNLMQYMWLKFQLHSCLEKLYSRLEFKSLNQKQFTGVHTYTKSDCQLTQSLKSLNSSQCVPASN